MGVSSTIGIALVDLRRKAGGDNLSWREHLELSRLASLLRLLSRAGRSFGLVRAANWGLRV